MGFFFGRRAITDYEPALSIEKLRRRVQIVVIDDEKDSFPHELLKESGYSLEYWPNVDHARLERLEQGQYDIIVLDIQGVAVPGLTSKDGIGILERIKKVNPAQVVVAFSGQSYDVEASKFWEIADDKLSKPVDVIRCKSILDDLIKKKVKISHMWAGLQQLLRQGGATDKQISKIEVEMVACVTGGKAIDQTKITGVILKGLPPLASALTIIEKIVNLAKG